MQLERLENEDVVLSRVALDDSDVEKVAYMLFQEGKKYGIYFSRYKETDPEMQIMHKQDDEAVKIEVLKQGVLKNSSRNRVLVWQAEIDEELAGYIVLNVFTGAPFLHFCLTEEYTEDVEEYAEALDQLLAASVEIMGHFFDSWPRDDRLWVFPHKYTLEEVETILVQHGFDEADHLDFVDYDLQGSYSISRKTYDIYHRGAEYE